MEPIAICFNKIALQVKYSEKNLLREDFISLKEKNIFP